MNEKLESWKEDLENRASKIEEKSDVPPEFLETEKMEDDDGIIATLEKDGWKLVDIITGAYAVNADNHPGKEIKIVGQGERHLVFERNKN